MFQPRKVREARAWLQQGNPRQAAYALLAARDPGHKDVVACRQQVADALLQIARQEYEAGALLASYEAVQLARKLTPLNEQNAVFAEKVEHEWEREKSKKQAVQQVEAQAQQWLQQRRYRQVLDLIEHFLHGLTDKMQDEARGRLLPLEAEAQTRLRSYEALLEQIRQAMQDKDLPRALMLWRQACERSSEDAELRQLAYELHQLEQQCRNDRVCVRVTERSQRLVLAKRWLVVLSAEIVLGLDQDATVPLLGRLHSRHARLFRDHGRYQVMPCRDRHGNCCPILINGKVVSNAHLLRDGDEIRLGPTQAQEQPLVFRFRQPLPDSGTAVLIQQQTSGRIRAGTVCLCSQVMLLDDYALFSPHAGQGHVHWPQLPCLMRLAWSREGLFWETQGGEALINPQAEEELACRSGPIFVPSRFTLSADDDMESSEVDVLERRIFQRDSEGKPGALLLEFEPVE